MGCWNVGIFDNDVALDSVEDLVEQNDSNLITDILYSVYTIAKIALMNLLMKIMQAKL